MLGIQLELRNNNSQREWKTYTKYVLASEQSNKKKNKSSYNLLAIPNLINFVWLVHKKRFAKSLFHGTRGKLSEEPFEKKIHANRSPLLFEALIKRKCPLHRFGVHLAEIRERIWNLEKKRTNEGTHSFFTYRQNSVFLEPPGVAMWLKSVFSPNWQYQARC